MKGIAPYGTWRSPVTASLAAAGAVRFGGVALDGDHVYWIEGRPAERGRNVVARRRLDDAAAPATDLTPAPFNVRSRVHEYGGGAFAARDGVVYFSNDADQRLWRQRPPEAPVPLTPEGRRRHADLQVDARRQRLICVAEDPPPPGASGEPENLLVSVPLAGGEARPLARGADFYASPRLSPDGRWLAWLSWTHPRMPWQGTDLWLAPVGDDGALGPARQIAGGPAESIFQPAWSPGGVLHFVSDRSGWWNLYRWRDGAAPASEPLWPVAAELGVAQWVFGTSTYGWIAPDTIVCAWQRDGVWRLGLLDAAGPGPARPLATELTEVSQVQADPVRRRAVFAASGPTETTAIRALSHDGAQVTTVYRPPGSVLPVDPASLSLPEPITFPTAGGAVAHGLFYPPRHAALEGPPGERPPLVVLSHGGPTAAAAAALSFNLQFWTTRGFAVLDVNYRGSTGYGRAYRQALDGAWGIADVEDCVAGARHLVAAGRVDPDRLAIRGGSAGGYTTLSALAFTDVFRAGASHYGVSDLEALARDTHKFESRYLDTLVGPYPERRDLYAARSPLHHAARVSCPVIFFQGLEDRVVPPDQTERMVSALRDKGIHVEYVAFPDEQHGFRSADNIVRALEAELAFYLKVFGLGSGPAATAGADHTVARPTVP
jgi:dipeptidyl aminopeptidase/acylaminoacyl peptidase